MQRLIRIAALSLLAAVTLALVLLDAGGAPIPAQELMPWRQGTLHHLGDAGFWWMAAEGGFARRQGLALKLTAFDSDVAMLQALQAGQIDTIEGSAVGPMISSSTGGDLKIIGCSWPKLTASFFARGDVHDLAALRGKVIGISAPGSMPDLIARAMLSRIDIAPQAVKLVPIGSEAERVRALADKRIDATVAASDYAARKDLQLRALARADDILPSFPRACLATRGEVWRKKPDALVALLAATMNAYRYALDHRTETVALTRRIAGLAAADPTPEASFDNVRENHAVAPALPIEMAKLLWLRDFLAEQGRIDADFEPGTMTDNSLRERALARVNAKP
jgi:NitT/TauT family transport system substrate-binding protein